MGGSFPWCGITNAYSHPALVSIDNPVSSLYLSIVTGGVVRVIEMLGLMVLHSPFSHD